MARAPTPRPIFGDRSPEGLATEFRRFGRVETPQLDSPLYAEFCEGVAADPELLAIAAHTQPSQPPPNMLFAAAQYLLMRGAQHRLVEFYPAISGTPRPDRPGFPSFREFCVEHREEIERLVATRRTQTNVLRRCSCLLPAFAEISRRGSGRALALVEIGSSAGLNLRWDQYAYEYSAKLTWGDPTCEIRLGAELRGGEPLPPLPEKIPVAWRLGIDLDPISLTDGDAVTWLRALIWPEHVDRHIRLQRAIELARPDPPEIVTGDAALELDALLGRAPADAALCVFATHTLYQFSRDARRAVYDTLQRRAAERPVDFISMEGTGGDHSELVWVRYRGSKRETTKLANCHPHGWWIEWLAREP